MQAKRKCVLYFSAPVNENSVQSARSEAHKSYPRLHCPKRPCCCSTRPAAEHLVPGLPYVVIYRVREQDGTSLPCCTLLGGVAVEYLTLKKALDVAPTRSYQE